MVIVEISDITPVAYALERDHRGFAGDHSVIIMCARHADEVMHTTGPTACLEGVGDGEGKGGVLLPDRLVDPQGRASTH